MIKGLISSGVELGTPEKNTTIPNKHMSYLLDIQIYVKKRKLLAFHTLLILRF